MAGAFVQRLMMGGNVVNISKEFEQILRDAEVMDRYFARWGAAVMTQAAQEADRAILATGGKKMTILMELLDCMKPSDGAGLDCRTKHWLLQLASLVDEALEAKEAPEKQAFMEQYAKRSGLTVKELGDLGLKAYPCDCGEPGCEGWRMITEVGHHAPKRRIIHSLGD